MSHIRLYMDEDSTARSLVLALQNRGVEVITSLIPILFEAAHYFTPP